MVFSSERLQFAKLTGKVMTIYFYKILRPDMISRCSWLPVIWVDPQRWVQQDVRHRGAELEQGGGGAGQERRGAVWRPQEGDQSLQHQPMSWYTTQIDININIAFVIQWTACSRTGNPWENAASRVAGESWAGPDKWRCRQAMVASSVKADSARQDLVM